MLRLRLWLCLIVAVAASGAERIFVDDAGVMRWTADRSEVALFGANYSLASSCDYRAAGYVGADRKKLVEEDFAHFARMGWDGIRLCFWGDWENSDHDGNLIANDHLDVLDYAIAEARKRGLAILFTPITTYSAGWPDGKPDADYPGFSSHFKKSELGTNPAAIAAQCNYLRQILGHVNPYTGTALKDEPAIVFIEMINEPWHHAEDLPGSVAYINALVDAVRATGCTKLLFHNLSQDFAIAPAIAASKVQGFTFAWYPTGLLARRTLDENYLRWADDYPPMQAPDLPRRPRIVYEFDSADMLSGYMYPAMTRSFRESGAQFAAMFSYDMLATAPFNLGWQTHFLNLVYSPRKAVSAIIAAEVMRAYPRGTPPRPYPENRRFGPFRVSYEEDSSEMVTAEKFIHANDTATPPPDAAALREVIGVGRSPVVTYDGLGAYFLERLAAGQWRLEVYPDAVIVQDPFAQKLNHESVSSRLVWRTRLMQIRLPDLGTAFTVTPLNAGNDWRPKLHGESFDVRPGVFLLCRKGIVADPARLPPARARIGLAEFVCPPAPDLPRQVVSHLRATYPADEPAAVDLEVVDAVPPGTVTLHVQRAGDNQVRTFAMTPTRGFGFRAIIPAGTFDPGELELSATIRDGATERQFPATGGPWRARLVRADEPLALFSAVADTGQMAAMRVTGDRRGNYFKFDPADASDPAALRLEYPEAGDPPGALHAVALPVKARIIDRRGGLTAARALRITGRSSPGRGPVRVALVEADGTGWTTAVPLGQTWSTIEIPLDQLAAGAALKLPLGYPGNWNYLLPPPSGRGHAGDRPRWGEFEQLQIALPPGAPAVDAEKASVEIAAVELVFTASGR